jgi:hypothetical protein
MERRQFLGSTAAVGGAALAGRVDGSSADVEVRSGDGPEVPSVPVGQAHGGWVVDRGRSRTFSDRGMGVTSTGTTVAYVDRGLAETLGERTIGTGFRELRLFFATRVDYSPAVDRLPFGIGRDVVVNRTASNARERFHRWLGDAGLEEIERRDTGSIDVHGGPRTDLELYDAVYPYDGFEFEAGGSTVSVAGDPIAVEGLLATWYDRGARATFVAGAVNPAENYERTVDRRLTEAVTLTLDVDLGLTPDAYRGESLELIRSVS